MIKLKLEKLVPIHLNILGFVFMLVALYNFLFIELINTLIGLFFLLLGLFLATATNGIIINKDAKSFKNTVFFLGLEIGFWKPLSKFTDIAILTQSKGIQALSRGQVATNFTNKVYEIYMLTENHRERVILKSYKEEGKAIVHSQDLAQQLNFQLNTYSPC